MKGEEIKMLSPKQILKRLPIALAQVKAVNTSDVLFNEIQQIVLLFVSSKRNLLKK